MFSLERRTTQQHFKIQHGSVVVEPTSSVYLYYQFVLPNYLHCQKENLYTLQKENYVNKKFLHTNKQCKLKMIPQNIDIDNQECGHHLLQRQWILQVSKLSYTIARILDIHSQPCIILVAQKLGLNKQNQSRRKESLLKKKKSSKKKSRLSLSVLKMRL